MVHGAEKAVRNAWDMGHGTWCMMHGVRCSMLDEYCVMGVACMLHTACFPMHGLDALCLVHGAWCMVHGMSCAVHRLTVL